MKANLIVSTIMLAAAVFAQGDYGAPQEIPDYGETSVSNSTVAPVDNTTTVQDAQTSSAPMSVTQMPESTTAAPDSPGYDGSSVMPESTSKCTKEQPVSTPKKCKTRPTTASQVSDAQSEPTPEPPAPASASEEEPVSTPKKCKSRSTPASQVSDAQTEPTPESPAPSQASEEQPGEPASEEEPAEPASQEPKSTPCTSAAPVETEAPKPPKKCKQRNGGGYGKASPESSTGYGNMTRTNDTVPSSCPAGANIGAVLFELSDYAGVKHWIDGGNSSYCRGLNGTDIKSIEILSAPGGDPIYSRATAEYANGITLVFYDDFGCAGNPVLNTTGNQRSVEAVEKPAKSVRIECNGQYNAGGNITAPAGDQYHFAIFKKGDNGSFTSFQDAHLNECAGGEGLDTTGIQFVNAVGADPATNAVKDEDAKQVKLAFFDDFGCLGNRTIDVVGNQKDLCKDGVCPKPKSYMLMSVDPKVIPKFPNVTQVQGAASVSGASQAVASVVGLLSASVLMFL